MMTITESTVGRTTDPAPRPADPAATIAPPDRRSVTSGADPTEIERLAWEVERTGLAGHEAEIARIVAGARPAGISPVLVDVLADPAEPECARIRAFGRVALGLGSHRRAA